MGAVLACKTHSLLVEASPPLLCSLSQNRGLCSLCVASNVLPSSSSFVFLSEHKILKPVYNLLSLILLTCQTFPLRNVSSSTTSAVVSALYCLRLIPCLLWLGRGLLSFAPWQFGACGSDGLLLI